MRRDFGGSSYPSVHQSCKIDQFIRLKPLSFEGGTDSIKAEMWMQEMEKIMAVLNCNEQKVLFATFQLAGKAERWCHVVKLLKEQRAVPIAMTWGHFKQVFYDRYFRVTTRTAKAEEFFNLTQGRLTIQHYATRFLKLSRFEPSMVPNEYQKARWFERGLNKRIHEHMACLQIQDFAELVEKAIVAESSLQRGAEASERRKRHASPSPYANVRQGSWRGDGDVVGQGSERNDRGHQGDSSRPHCPRCY
ncbi:uncharacterized protein LOC131145918 [Malania oleifera]|uniref:uncharacterized protein LOC131145918 n=1 Tax=Malania oleifera TaxID=397392 RepID=UPI0025AEA9A7|nr:uncharacterized protein LOC131145918 [Malania oleifera]